MTVLSWVTRPICYKDRNGARGATNTVTRLSKGTYSGGPAMLFGANIITCGDSASSFPTVSVGGALS